jgi:hypothetical protein
MRLPIRGSQYDCPGHREIEQHGKETRAWPPSGSSTASRRQASQPVYFNSTSGAVSRWAVQGPGRR